MTEWDPDLYRLFEGERTRPARDLLARVPLSRPTEVVDLGCGPGNSTELLLSRFPDARLTGVDNSEAMLASARRRLPGLAFERADVTTWSPVRPIDLLYANAVLQWLPDHTTLLPRLMGLLSPGGVLALQMPDNLDEPSHRLMREVAAAGPWRDRIAGAGDARATVTLTPSAYYDLLAPLAAEVDIWRTTYHHPLPSPVAVVDWLRSTGLRPFLEPLSELERATFLRDYGSALAEAYPPRVDGRTLLAFPRLFVVARRTGTGAR